MKTSELENILSGALNKLHKQDTRKLKEKKKKEKQRELSRKQIVRRVWVSLLKVKVGQKLSGCQKPILIPF